MSAKKSRNINLLELGKQITLTAKGLQQQVKTTGKPVGISASKLAGKIKDLEALGALKIFQLREDESDDFKINTLTAFKDGDKCDLYDIEHNPLGDFEFLSYKSGKQGFVVVRHASGLEITAAISCSKEYLFELEEDDTDGEEGEGIPPLKFLRDVPNPETPLSSSVMPIGVELTVISNGKVSKQHKTPLVDVRLPDGTVQKNVICNTALDSLYQKYGDGMKFKIAKKREVELKKEERKICIVDIIDCQIDLSDL
jgi:hypothetical protein